MRKLRKVTVSANVAILGPHPAHPRLNSEFDLAQIEAIVQDIEQEKEAGKTKASCHMSQSSLYLLPEAERKRSRLAATALAKLRWPVARQIHNGQ